jgi:hypothetical protein
LSAQAGNYCTYIQGTGIAYFQWKYYDPSGYNETQYEIQVATDSGFSNIVIDRMVYYVNISSGSSQSLMMLVKANGTGDLNYNTAYYWRVRVKNSAGLWSNDWAEYNDAYNLDDEDGNPETYTFPYAHPSPIPAYSYTPTSPVLSGDGAEVTFIDSSIVYASEDTRTWNFGDSGKNLYPETNPPTLVDPANPFTHTYTQAGTFSTSLQICDDIYCCTSTMSIKVGTSGATDLPIWKEISPF